MFRCNVLKRYLATLNNEVPAKELESLLAKFTSERLLIDESKLNNMPKTDLKNHSVITVQKKTVPPFVYLPNAVSLEVALEPSNTLNKRYQEFLNVSSTRKQNHDRLDASMDYEEAFSNKVEWKEIFGEPREISLKYPQGTREAFIEFLNKENAFDKTSLDELIDNISVTDERFAKYTFDNIVFLFVELLDSIKLKNTQKVVLNELNDLFKRRILEFHDEDLIHISRSFLKSSAKVPEAVKIVNTISESYNSKTQLDNVENAFISRAPIPMINEYLKASLQIQDLLTSKPLLELLTKNKFLPDKEVVTNYIELSANLCATLPIASDQQTLLFNGLTASLKDVLTERNMLNPKIISCLFKHAKCNQLDLLISYLQLNPEYEHLKNNIVASTIEKFQTNREIGQLSGMKRATLLTSLLHKIGTHANDNINIEIRNAIVVLYASAKSTLGCLLWAQAKTLDQLDETVLQTLN